LSGCVIEEGQVTDFTMVESSNELKSAKKWYEQCHKNIVTYLVTYNIKKKKFISFSFTARLDEKDF